MNISKATTPNHQIGITNNTEESNGGNGHVETQQNDTCSPLRLLESALAPIQIPERSQVLLVNDGNNNVTYGQGWEECFIPEALKPQPGHTFHSTPTPGASLFFRFAGTQVYVYGFLPPGDGPISASYSIDSGPPVNQSVEISDEVDSFLGNHTLFVSDSLPFGVHNISILVTQTGQGRYYNLDFFEVVQPLDDVRADADSPTPSPSTKSKPNVNVIIGGILGGLVLIVSLVGLFFFMRRRRISGKKGSMAVKKPQMMYYGRVLPWGWAAMK